MASNNPYDEVNLDAEGGAIKAPAPENLSADRGEPDTKAPRSKKKGVYILAGGVLLIGVLAVGLFGFLFFRNVIKSKDADAVPVVADAALQQKTSNGPDLGAYQASVAKALDEEKKRQAELDAEKKRTAAEAQPAAGAATSAAAPALGNYGGSGNAAAPGWGDRPVGDKKPNEKTPREIAAERRLKGEVMWVASGATGGSGQQRASSGQSAARSGQGSRSYDGSADASGSLAGGSGAGGIGGGSESGGIGGMLETESYPAGTAMMRPDLKFLLIHGTTASCVLLPRIVTNYPGQTRCMINRDVYSADGSVVLIRAGSFANGERKVAMKQGVAKVFVVWRDVEMPDGGSIRFDSMAADQLGAAGLDAWVDNHIPERFAGAVALSLIDDGLKLLADQARGSDGVTFDSSTNNAQDMASIALENSINIPPTGYVQQATELTIVVARDVDLRSIYGVN
ncbi:hypothetical protein PS623_04359 [Pseudomonas fluorescens]|uniref:TrbI/VirB10 family protein n=1 Tax=Pseudomonas fluorescens TaxID=294 RepID=UPI001241779C|nr:TrbI/VirB10 family protein [Pseudomonas fluorescens]VVN22436.1 hypothetical protein PS623_04359 [Pseudomonas fluorescens]